MCTYKQILIGSQYNPPTGKTFLWQNKLNQYLRKVLQIIQFQSVVKQNIGLHSYVDLYITWNALWTGYKE